MQQLIDGHKDKAALLPGNFRKDSKHGKTPTRQAFT
jgi:hypothetical protein